MVAETLINRNNLFYINDMKTKILKIFTLAFCLLSLLSCKDTKWEVGDLSPIITIGDVRNLHKGTDVVLQGNLSGATQIVGVVTSDVSGKNVAEGTITMQNFRRKVNRGITLAIGVDAANYTVGDSIIVTIEGATLKSTNGSLQITGLNANAIRKVASNSMVNITPVTAFLLKSNPGDYEGTLVKMFSASVDPVPVSGDTYKGDKKLSDGSGSIVLHTEAAATFAERRVPASATFVGVPLIYNESGAAENAEVRLWPRTIQDVIDASGPIYPNFPEDFEVPDQSFKPSYNMNTAAVPDNNVEMKTGNWKLFQSILAATAGRDRFNPSGLQCVRMQQNLSVSAYVQMNFDVPNGASKLSLSYGSYYNDAGSTFRVEYSTDQGVTWTQIGPDVKDGSSTAKTLTILMDISGPVRFRVNKLGLGTTNNTTINNGRFSIEDIAIYSN
jgi:hypothetical protein